MNKEKARSVKADASIQAAVIKALRSPIDSNLLTDLRLNDPRPGIERIITALVRRAAEGEVAAARELREYLKLKTRINRK